VSLIILFYHLFDKLLFLFLFLWAIFYKHYCLLIKLYLCGLFLLAFYYHVYSVILKQKGGLILIFSISRFCLRMAKWRLCWFILIDYILVDKNTSISRTSITGTP
jgi:hypothetical protein